MREFVVAEVLCRLNDHTKEVIGNGITGELQAGTVIPALVTAPDGAQIEIGLVRWEDGQMDLRAFSRLNGPTSYDRLTKGVRMGVRVIDEQHWCELRILEYGDPADQPTMVSATWSDFDQMISADAQKWLRDLGDVRIGTRADLLEDTGKRRNQLALMAPADDPLPLFAAYVLSRVLPVLRGFGKPQLIPAGAT